MRARELLNEYEISEIIALTEFKEFTEDDYRGYAGVGEGAYIGEFKDCTIVMDEKGVEVYDPEDMDEAFLFSFMNSEF